MTGSNKRFTFTGSHGEELAARLDLPIGKPKAYALFAHCFTCSKDVLAASRIADEMTGHGIAVLRFDFTGLGKSAGEFSNTNFSSNVADLVKAADHMRESLEAPQILIGHSLGGSAVLVAAELIAEVKAVATIGAPGDPSHVEHIFKGSIADIETSGSADVTLAGREFCIEKQFLDDIRSQNLDSVVGRFRKALLVLHAPGDEVVGIENASQIFMAAKHPKSFVSLDGADHFLLRRKDAAFAACLIAAWAGRYIDAGAEVAPDPSAVEGTVVVAETGTGRFASTVVTGSGHVLRADEPAALGGDDTGATPYDLLLSALGVCKVMTMRMYAGRKGYNLDRAEVRMSHNKVYARDCEKCETEVGKVDLIKADITLTGDLTDEERQAIFAIAEKCPVHRTITSEVIIETELSSR